MKRLFLFTVLILVVLITFVSCSESDGGSTEEYEIAESTPVPRLTIKKDELICDKCDSFGMIVELYDGQLLVGELEKVWIFDYSDEGMNLVQEIQLRNYGQLNNITAMDGRLFIGVIDEFGSGKLRAYFKNGNSWEFRTSYEVGRKSDDFGGDVHTSVENMVIGASARFSASFDPNISDQGSCYIYSKNGTGWELVHEFFAENSDSDDRFGSDVAIWEDYVLVSGMSIPLHIFKKEGNGWNLSKVAHDILPIDLAIYNETVIYFDEMTGLHSFKIAADGTLTDIAIDQNIGPLDYMIASTDGISMYQNYALIQSYFGTKAYLLRLENGEWKLENSFSEDLGNNPELHAISLNEEKIAFAGTDYDNFKSHVFLKSY